MIEPKEIRKGIFVYRDIPKLGKIIVTVQGFILPPNTDMGIVLYQTPKERGECSISEIFPIDITEDRLRELGFTIYKAVTFYQAVAHRDDLSICLDYNDIIWKWHNPKKKSVICNNIHTLQNIAYFSHGIELIGTIK